MTKPILVLPFWCPHSLMLHALSEAERAWAGGGQYYVCEKGWKGVGYG